MAIPHAKRDQAIGVLGWCGVLATLLAYLLVSFSLLAANSVLYQLLNLGAAVAIGTETWSKRDFQPFWLNIAWGLIATVALIRLLVSI